MKRIFYLEKHMKIDQESCELSTASKKLSSTEETTTNCQKLNERSSKLKSDSFSMFVTLSLSSINSRVRQRDFSVFFDFICFNVLWRRFTRVRIRENFSSVNENSNFNFSCVRFRFFHETSTQKRSRRTHSTHLKWFFMITQKINSSKQRRQIVVAE